MSKRPWYKRYPSDFIAGTLDLTLEEKGAYSTVIDLLNDRGAPIPDDPQWISRVCGCSTRKWNKIRERLIGLGKIVGGDGVLSNGRFNGEIKSRINGDKTDENTPKDQEQVVEKTTKVSNSNDVAIPPGGARAPLSRSQSPDKKKPPHKPPPDDDLLDIPLMLDKTDRGEAVRKWNTMAGSVGLPIVQRKTDPRWRSLGARLDECGGLPGWDVALKKVECSEFLTGDNDRGWRATFDWVIKAANFTKLMEGSYANNAPKPPVDDLAAAEAAMDARVMG